MATKKKPARKVAKKVTKVAKKKPVKPIPPGYHVVTAYLCIDGAADAIDFYKRVFGAIEDPFGHVWHIATHTEDLSMAEMKRRGEAAAKSGTGG